MLTSFGTAEKTYTAGEELDVNNDEAKALLDAGYATPVGKPPAKKAATRKKAESK